MKRRSIVSICAVAAALSWGVVAPAHAVQSCSFGASGGLALTFPDLDPSLSGPPTVYATFVGAGTASATWGGCSAQMSMTATSGTTLSSNSWALKGPNGATIPYSVTLPSGKATGQGYVAFTLAAQILGPDYVDAVAGPYADNLVITVIP